MDRRTVLRSVGASGIALLAGCSGSGGGSSTPTTTTSGPEVDLVNYKFEPGTDEALNISAGTTVTFVWKTGGHNIHVDSQPDGANWSGHKDIEDAGFTFDYTFTVKGTYHFWCIPHKSLGMVGDIVVT